MDFICSDIQIELIHGVISILAILSNMIPNKELYSENLKIVRIIRSGIMADKKGVNFEDI